MGVGGQNFLGKSKGRTSFFSGSKGRGPEFFYGHGGGQNFSPRWGPKLCKGVFFHKGGGDQNFLRRPRGDQNFFVHAKGGPEKIADPRSQTDGPPFPVKNDSSLRSCHFVTPRF